MARPARVVSLSTAEREQLAMIRRAPSSPQGLALRAAIALLAADGATNAAIAQTLGCSLPTVVLWRRRCADRGITGLYDEAGRGRRPTYEQSMVDKIVASTLGPPPSGRTHWSSRVLAAQVGVSATTVRRVWRSHRLQPHRTRSFKFSTDPDLVSKVTDVIGLYLHPPEKALVLCADEKSQIQALDRTQPLLPLRPGQVERRTHDYVRHGTTTLFAALDLATGAVTGRCYRAHRHQEFLRFLQVVATTYPRRQIHLVLDNYSTHKHARVERWLRRHRRFHLHFTPTSASWMNQVETWFSLLTRQAIRRGSFKSVAVLQTAIERFIAQWNDHCHPFSWVKTPDEILAKAIRKANSGAVH
jgi:transposase